MITDLSALRPYKGPIPFVEEDSGRFFGRETDIENLRGMLRTERILLLHSPSGAGKTSLLQAGLIPRMRQDGFRVLPPIRVGHPLPKQASETPGTNRYAYSVIRSLETALSTSAGEAAQGDRIEDLADIPLSTYFAHRSALRAPDERLLLVFDQFEEVFTMSPHERSGRLRFFSELGAVLQDKKIWALFAIKEEYVGALDAYSRFLPNHFAARYHLDFLTRSAAEQAVRGPLEHVQAPFDPEVVEAILADLTRTDGQEPADSVPQQGEAQEFEDLSDAAVIDPLHLQLVCAQVWSQVQRLNLNKVSMDAVVKIREVAGLSAVDAALMQYYDSRIEEAPKSAALSEREIRDWIEEELIQDGRTRRQTLANPNSDSDLAGLQSYLEDQHVLRASLRGDSKWYELAHDRLVFLIRKSNEEWYDKNLSLFERHARKWRQLGEPQDFRALPWRVWRKYATGFWGQSKVPLRSEWEEKYLAYCRNRTWKRSVKLAVVPLVLSFLCSLVLYELWKGQKLENTARRLQALAMQQRYTYQNHDTALLLGSLAKGFRDQVAKQKTRLGPLLSSVEVDRAVWTALEAYPFSRTLPEEVLGGQPKELMQNTSGVSVLVKNMPGMESGFHRSAGEPGRD